MLKLNKWYLSLYGDKPELVKVTDKEEIDNQNVYFCESKGLCNDDVAEYFIEYDYYFTEGGKALYIDEKKNNPIVKVLNIDTKYDLVIIEFKNGDRKHVPIEKLIPLTTVATCSRYYIMPQVLTLHKFGVPCVSYKDKAYNSFRGDVWGSCHTGSKKFVSPWDTVVLELENSFWGDDVIEVFAGSIDWKGDKALKNIIAGDKVKAVKDASYGFNISVDKGWEGIVLSVVDDKYIEVINSEMTKPIKVNRYDFEIIDRATIAEVCDIAYISSRGKMFPYIENFAYGGTVFEINDYSITNLNGDSLTDVIAWNDIYYAKVECINVEVIRC